MKKMIKYLEQNNIKYEIHQYGNPYYFNDNFTVDGITVFFSYCEPIGENDNDYSLLQEFRKHMKRQRTYSYQWKTNCDGVYYIIMTKKDRERLTAHSEKIKKTTEAFYKERNEAFSHV